MPLQPYVPIESERVAPQLPLEENPEFLEVSVQRVYNNLLHLDNHKAPGPDGLSNWVLKEYAEILVIPDQNILHASYSEQGQQSRSQEAVDAIYDWSKENLFQLNGEKTKELVVSFSRDSPQLSRVCLDGTPI